MRDRERRGSVTSITTDPIDNIIWLQTEEIKANWWNPNRVYKREFDLLKHSLMTTGWIQPILVNTNMLIIDGFHRWRLSSDDADVIERWGGRVPCAILPVSDIEAKVITVRINRAKGTHVAVGMAELVKEMVEVDGVTPEWIASQIGADLSEVEILLLEDIFEARNVKDWEYSKSWYPDKVKQ